MLVLSAKFKDSHCYFLMAYGGVAQRFALPALGRAAERRPTGKMLRRRKMLGIAPESPASGARFVGRFFECAKTILRALFFLFYQCHNNTNYS